MSAAIAPDAAARINRRPRTAQAEAWGILNPWGDVWTYHTFDSKEAAEAFVQKFWRDFPGSKPDTRRFKAIRVKVVVSVPKAKRSQISDTEG